MSTILVNEIEALIQDPTKQLPDTGYDSMGFDRDGNWVRRLNAKNRLVYDIIYGGATGKLGYYGIPFFLYESTDMAFYKSLDGSFYFIESCNSKPVRYYKIE